MTRNTCAFHIVCKWNAHAHEMHLGQKKKICVFQVSRPYLGFCPDSINILLWIVSKMLSNLLENGEKCIEKCNFYIK